MFEYKPVMHSTTQDPFWALQQERNFYTENAKDLLKNAAAGWTDEHEEKYKKIVDELGKIDEATKAATQKLQRQVRSETPVEPVSEFRDAGGRVIYAYKPGQRVSESKPEYSLGTLIRGMLAPNAVPSQVRNDLSEGVDSAGGYSVPMAIWQEFIDLMRSRLVANQAGVRTVILDTLQTRIVRLESDPASSWRAENSEIIKTDPTFSAIELKAKNLAVLVKASNELLQDSLNVEEMILHSIASETAGRLDEAIFYGQNTDPNSPTGLIFDTNIPTIPAAGPLTDYSTLLAGLESLSTNNADVTRAAIVLHPRDFYKLQGLSDSTGQPLQQPAVIGNRPIFPTTMIDATEGVGTNETRIFIGDYSNIIMGIRQDAQIRVLRERYSEFNQTAFLLTMRVDVAVAQPKALAMVTGITP